MPFDTDIGSDIDGDRASHTSASAGRMKAVDGSSIKEHSLDFGVVDIDDSSSVSDASSDGASETSTLVYDHETFETFQHRVRELISAIYSVSSAGTAVLTRLPGGSFNRVIGISLLDAETELILRVPRYDSADVDLQVKVLSWLSTSTTLPVPKVVAHALTSANSIGQPYMLMERLEGHRLEEVLEGMSDDQRISMAVQVAQLIGAIHKVPVPCAIGPLVSDDHDQIRVGRLIDVDADSTAIYDERPPPATLCEYLSMRFKDQRQYYCKEWPNDTYRRHYCDQLLHASQILAASPSGQHTRHVLYHPDLAGRNILVQNIATPGTDAVWKISGLLDWDDCAVVPIEIAYTCPGWLWDARIDPPLSFSFRSREYDPDLPPYDELSTNIRDAFIDAVESVLPGYIDVIRSSLERRLRELHRLARRVIRCDMDVKAAEFVIDAASHFVQDPVESGVEA